MNPLFNMIAGGAGRGQTQPEGMQANQSQQMDFNTAMSQLQADPARVLSEAHFNVPQECIGNNQATVMHLIRSGQVGGPMMRMIAPMLARMGVKI